MITVTRAILLAAGRGTRMGALSRQTPKPLQLVAGRSLLDHALDRLAEAGIREVVVNVHHLAEHIGAALAARRQRGEGPHTQTIVEEVLLETGGGVANALPLLGDQPFFVVNSDALWQDEAKPALSCLAEAWDGKRMSSLLLLVQPFGGRGDFQLDEENRCTRYQAADARPAWRFAGVELLGGGSFTPQDRGVFSRNRLFDRAIATGRLFGLVHRGRYCHVGDAIALRDAQADWGRANG